MSGSAFPAVIARSIGDAASWSSQGVSDCRIAIAFNEKIGCAAVRRRPIVMAGLVPAI
jgi:hypothetical protein